MAPQAPAAAAKAQTASPARRVHTAQSRWPLFLSIFGALGLSVLLWVGIIWSVSQAIDWVNGAS